MAERVGMNLAVYRDVIDKGIALAEAIAALTGETWDDGIAAMARTLFEKLIPQRFGSAAGVTEEMALGMMSASERAQMPVWLIPVVVTVIRLILFGR